MTKTTDFDYYLPTAMIAQTPVEPRDSSRLMVLQHDAGIINHHIFADLPGLLDEGDLLVLNDTRVLPVRLFGYKSTGGKVEILLLHQRRRMTWEVLVGGKGIHIGSQIERIGELPDLNAIVMEELDGGHRVLQFSGPVLNLLQKIGHMPLPPYIKTPLADPDRYQTIYANASGSAAAPTAGLHLTSRLLKTLEDKGINIAKITLHIGLDTFAPIKSDEVESHKIHSEWCMLDRTAAKLINNTQLAGKRVIAVGTTSARTIETAAGASSTSGVFSTRALIHPEQRQPGKYPVSAFSGQTELFITPGYEFRTVRGMLTNFHLPKSTLLVMIAAFCGKDDGLEKILNAYDEAKKNMYRFYSLGDAMLIL